MWSRVSIKSYAKDFLRKHYWKAFLVCLIVSILGGSGSSNNSSNSRNHNLNNHHNQIMNEMDEFSPLRINNSVRRFTTNRIVRSPIFYLVGGSMTLIFSLFLILLITIGYALEVGKARFFLLGFKGDVNIGNLFSTFNMEEYFGIVKAQFLRGLYTLLWTLLFIIPGIIKRYEYRMVPYILSEYPQMSSSRAIQMSRNMTDGHKMDMFILDLSFLGWDLLGGLLFGIGGIFVNPYKEATEARLYNIISGNDPRDREIMEEDIILE